MNPLPTRLSINQGVAPRPIAASPARTLYFDLIAARFAQANDRHLSPPLGKRHHPKLFPSRDPLALVKAYCFMYFSGTLDALTIDGRSLPRDSADGSPQVWFLLAVGCGLSVKCHLCVSCEERYGPFAKRTVSRQGAPAKPFYQHRRIASSTASEAINRGRPGFASGSRSLKNAYWVCMQLLR